MKLIYIIYWGAYSAHWYFVEIIEKIINPPLKLFLTAFFNVFTRRKKNIEKSGLTLDEYLDNSFVVLRKYYEMDITGSTAYYVKTWRTLFWLLFMFDILMLCKRIIGGYLFDNYITLKYAMYIICFLYFISCLFDSFLDKRLGGRKKNRKFQKSPASEKIKYLFIYSAYYALLVIVFFILVSKWTWFYQSFQDILMKLKTYIFNMYCML